MIFRFGKTTFDFDVEKETSVQDLKKKLSELTDCASIKLIYGGKVLQDSDYPVVSIPGGNNAKLTVIGTDPISITSQQLEASSSTSTRVIDDLSDNVSNFPTRGKPSAASSGNKHLKQSQYRFHNIETLPNLPNRDRALEILTELANDVGVLAVMEKYKFQVGTLCELYPEGYVGVSDVCVMGLNENKGQRLLLRLRTDDLKGFRKYLSIKKVLYHELAHNVHSEHNGDFYILMRQIEKDVALLDWRNSKGVSTGYVRGSNHSNVVHDRGDLNYYTSSSGVEVDNQVHILGGGNAANALLQQYIPARYLAGTAAIMRLSAEEQEVEDNCGSSVQHDRDIKNKSVTTTTSNNDENAAVVVEGNVSSSTDVNNMVVDEPHDQQSPPLNTTSATATTVVQVDCVSMGPAVIEHQVAAAQSPLSTVVPTVVAIETEDATPSHIISVTNTPADTSPPVESSQPSSTVTAILSPSPPHGPVELLESIQSTVLTGIDDSIAFALGVESSAAPVEKLLQLRTAMDVLLHTTACGDMVSELCISSVGGGGGNTEPLFLKCLKLLQKIISNAKDHAGSNTAESAKFKTIKKSTNTFQRYIQSVPNAVDILYSAGFTDDGEQLRLTRQDPGLLYIVSSMLSGAVETIEQQMFTTDG